MKRVEFSDSYLAETEFSAPSSHKLIYLFILIFRGVHRNEIRWALGLADRTIQVALESLESNGLIVIDGKGRCRLPSPQQIPLERYGREDTPLPWYSGGVGPK